jgi:CubicO group peptidase (beta-lactamase class C family)
MAKTITAMLIGIAISEGRIKSVDEPVVAYVPGLASTEYGKTHLRDLLHMSSGSPSRKSTTVRMMSVGCGRICSPNLGKARS